MTAHTHVLRSRSPADTRALGAQIGRLATPGLVIALSGDLGAGKTTFTQGLAQGLGVTVTVTSPTFTLVAEYDARAGMRLIHMDSYRLGDLPADAALEAETFGFEELLDDPAAVLVIEWAERLAALLPPETLYISFARPDDGDGDPDARIIRLTAAAAPATDIVAALAGIPV